MGKKKHFVSNIDEVLKVGDCAHCGRVKVQLKKGKYWTCREARKEYANYPNRNKRKTNLSRNLALRVRAKQKYVDYAGGKCVFCGYFRCLRSLHFHHVDPKEKDFEICRSYKNWEKAKTEIDKCILVCSNCHGEIHDGFISQDEVLEKFRAVV